MHRWSARLVHRADRGRHTSLGAEYKYRCIRKFSSEKELQICTGGFFSL